MFWKKKDKGLSLENPVRADSKEEEYAFVSLARCPHCKTVGEWKLEVHASRYHNGKELSIHQYICGSCAKRVQFIFDCTKQFEQMRAWMSPAERELFEEIQREMYKRMDNT